MTTDDAFELIDAYERDPNAPENRNNLRIILDSLPVQNKGEYTPAEVRALVGTAKFCLAANGDLLCDRERGHLGLHRGSDRDGKRARWRR